MDGVDDCVFCGRGVREGDLKGDMHNVGIRFERLPGDANKSCCSCKVGLDWDRDSVDRGWG